MIDFWMNHFNVTLKDDQVAPDFEQNAIRRNAFGKFEDLLWPWRRTRRCCTTWTTGRALRPPRSCSSASRRSKPRAMRRKYLPVLERMPFLEKNKGLNENYARELMELHTLGVDGGYAQADVIAVAKVLTG
jgi:uncharacterized protein (DUF1800 family)